MPTISKGEPEINSQIDQLLHQGRYQQTKGKE